MPVVFSVSKTEQLHLILNADTIFLSVQCKAKTKRQLVDGLCCWHQKCIFVSCRCVACMSLKHSRVRSNCTSSSRCYFRKCNRILASATARAAATTVLLLASSRGARCFSTIPEVMIEQYQHLTIHHYQGPVGSTQDEARKLLRTHPSGTVQQQYSSLSALAVIADQQTAGRGTNGRKWEAAQGNLFLTVCIPMDTVPVLLTLLPLQVGVLVAERIERFLAACSCQEEEAETKTTRVFVKWPNDVLINEKKVSGTLIESEVVENTTWLIIGIGVNVAFAPNLTYSPGKQIRPSTCIQDHCCASNDERLPLNSAVVLGKDLAQALVKWTLDKSLDRKDKGKKVIDDWISFAKFGEKLEVRGTVEEESSGSYRGENVTVLGIKDDGQLIVLGADGRERTLIADYMY